LNVKRSRGQIAAALNDAIRVSQTLTDAFDEEVARALGVNRTDYRLIDILDREGPVTAGRLAEAAGLTTGALTTAVDRLERAGYAVRLRAQEDRRRVLVELAPKARRTAGKFYEGMATGAAELFADYTDEQLELILEFLRRGIELSRQQLALLQERPAARHRGE
jgi:DNA-binding MarR family transcriptional regulator